MTDPLPAKDGPSKCFVIMPFRVREGDLATYHDDKGHWLHVYESLIEPAVKAAGLQCERDDEDASTRLVVDGIWQKVENADLVLCDLSSLNPNVFLELGWAMRADSRFVLIIDDVTKRPFDVSGIFQHAYPIRPSGLRSNIEPLAKVIRATMADEARRYSMVRRMRLETGAIEAALQGDTTAQMLLAMREEIAALRDVQRKSRRPRERSRLVDSQCDRCGLVTAKDPPGRCPRCGRNEWTEVSS